MASKLDRLAELRAQLGPGLTADETLTVAEPIRRALGSDDATGDEQTARARRLVDRVTGGPQPDRPHRWFERATDVAAAALTDTSPIDLPTPELPDPNGAALIGAAGSRAAWLRDLMGDRRCVLAGTPRRWFVLGDDAGGPARFRALTDGVPLPYAVLAELPRAELTVRSAPTLLSRGRLEIHFTDRSMLAVSALTRDRARALAGC